MKQENASHASRKSNVDLGIGTGMASGVRHTVARYCTRRPKQLGWHRALCLVLVFICRFGQATGVELNGTVPAAVHEGPGSAVALE